LAATKIIATKALSPKGPLRGHKEKGQKFKEAEERYKTLKKKEL
jgi:hypothetical protein